jgi:hypothetical protein
MDSVPVPLFAVSVAATIIGPLAAVIITQWWQKADRDYQRRLSLFQTMMRTRRQQLSADWVGAVNLVPVEFSQHRDVIESVNRLLDRLSDPGWRGSQEQIQRAIENADTAASELLYRMAAALKINLRGLDLRRAYSPQGWATDEDQDRNARNGLMQLLQGQRAIHVRLDGETEQSPETPPTTEPPTTPYNQR